MYTIFTIIYSCYSINIFMIITTSLYIFFFFFNDTASTEIYTLSLHDALPILMSRKIILIKQELLLLVYELNRSGLLNRSSDLKIILIKQELLLLVYELNRSGLLAENEKIRPILAQLEKLLLCDLSPSTNDSVKNWRVG